MSPDVGQMQHLLLSEMLLDLMLLFSSQLLKLKMHYYSPAIMKKVANVPDIQVSN